MSPSQAVSVPSGETPLTVLSVLFPRRDLLPVPAMDSGRVQDTASGLVRLCPCGLGSLMRATLCEVGLRQRWHGEGLDPFPGVALWAGFRECLT